MTKETGSIVILVLVANVDYMGDAATHLPIKNQTEQEPNTLQPIGTLWVARHMICFVASPHVGQIDDYCPIASTMRHVLNIL